MTRLIALAVLVFCVTSCSPLLRSEFSADARPSGGYDGPRGADQLYFVVRNMHGFDGGLNALCLPEDWPDRERVRDARGRLVLAEPIEEIWRTEEELDPPPVWGRSYEDVPFSPDIYHGEVFLVVGVADDVSMPRFEREAETALGAGANTYLLRPLVGDEHAAYEVLGAVGPPLEWVHLTEVRFEDRRSPAEKIAWNWVGRPLVVVDNVAYVGGIFFLVYLGIESL